MPATHRRPPRAATRRRAGRDQRRAQAAALRLGLRHLHRLAGGRRVQLARPDGRRAACLPRGQARTGERRPSDRRGAHGPACDCRLDWRYGCCGKGRRESTRYGASVPPRTPSPGQPTHPARAPLLPAAQRVGTSPDAPALASLARGYANVADALQAQLQARRLLAELDGARRAIAGKEVGAPRARLAPRTASRRALLRARCHRAAAARLPAYRSGGRKPTQPCRVPRQRFAPPPALTTPPRPAASAPPAARPPPRAAPLRRAPPRRAEHAEQAAAPQPLRGAAPQARARAARRDRGDPRARARARRARREPARRPKRLGALSR